MIREQDAPAPVREAFRLSAQQRRLWLAQGEEGHAYRTECTVCIFGDLSVELLGDALQAVAERHEILRTTFRRRRGIKVPFQVIDGDAAAHPLASGGPLRPPSGAAPRRPFDYERGPLFRASLRAVAPGEHALRLELSALCCDLRGLQVLVGETAQAYAACLGQGSLPDEPVQYADYSDWQEEQLAADEEGGAAPGVAPRELAATLEAMRLPWQRDPAGAAFHPESVPVAIEPELARDLDLFAASRGASFGRVLLAAWQTLLWRLTGRPEIVVGTRFDGREIEDLRNVIGLYDWWAPVAVVFAADRPFTGIFEQTGEALREADHWRPYQAGEDLPLFPIGFEAHELMDAASAAGLTFTFEEPAACCEPFRLKLAAFRRQGRLRLELHHDPAALTGEAVARLGQQLRTLLRSALDEPARPVADLDVLGADERERLLVAVNATAAEPGRPTLVHRRFEEQAESDPGRVALVCEDRRMTYGEADAAANRLAHRLAALGVGPEVRTAILLERSVDYVVALLAILKAGGCYVPLDPSYPKQRLGRMIEDARTKVLVTRAGLAEEIRADGLRLLDLDAEGDDIARRSSASPVPQTVDGNLAYVLFTSGSTGAPKGVAVEHRQLAGYVDAIVRRLDLPRGAALAAMSTFAADLGNTALFPALCTGGCFHLLSADEAASPAALARHCERHPVDGLKVVPSLLAALLGAAEDPARLLPRRWLVLGGEACHWELVERVRRSAPDLSILNHYGPTETTVGATACRVGERPSEPWSPATVPVGRPLANVRVFLLDPRLRPVPTGVPGEIYIGGAGVARGYLGRPDLTAERFVPDPLGGEPGVRFYRTGDLARFLPGGDLEFLGRVDHQVKIRGFRVEIGEVEAGLAGHATVAEAVVVAREDQPGERRLVAYVVPRRGQSPDAETLRSVLRQKLPDYMVPAAFVFLSALPLTANGKVDRAALPAPERAQPGRGASFVAPRDATERELARIWREVLGLERVGIHDNFFQLGGDSILSIDVIARANKVGLRLTPRQIFQHQTIAELAVVAGKGPGVEAEQGRVSGEVPLTPIQRWFFEREIESLHHWNQAVLLEVPSPSPWVLARAVDVLVDWHDAFRLRFERTADGWRQRHADPEPGLSWAWIDLAAVPEPFLGAAIEEACTGVQRSLSLAAGPLARVVLLDLGGCRPARLLWTVHHLIVDGVSWRILLADFAAACRQLAAGRPVELPPKTTSYKRWAERLAEHAESDAVRAEVDLWLRAVPESVPPLPVDLPGPNTVASERSCAVFLAPEETRALLQEVPAAYRTRIHEVLLTALARAAGSWTGRPSLLVELEGHGRDPDLDDIDLSRTVGWFTTRYPVHLDLAGSRDAGNALKAVKERLRALPANGMGYGVLRYLGKSEDARRLRARPEPEVVFNYLGQLDQIAAESGALTVAQEPCGLLVAPEGRRRTLLEVVASVAGGRLGATWTYSRNVHRRETIVRLAAAFVEELRAIVAHCRSAEAGGLSPSDFPLAALDQERLDKVLAAIASRKDSHR